MQLANSTQFFILLHTITAGWEEWEAILPGKNGKLFYMPMMNHEFWCMVYG